MNKETIEQALTPLVGLPLRTIGRAADLLWLHFGEMHEVAARGGGVRTVGEWAIHVQCAWRLCQQGRIRVACQDYYCSPEGEVLKDWDVIGKSLFDQQASSLRERFKMSPPKVTSYTVDDVGGFSMALSDDYRLDVFPDGSNHSEHWRLFTPASHKNHFVVT